MTRTNALLSATVTGIRIYGDVRSTMLRHAFNRLAESIPGRAEMLQGECHGVWLGFWTHNWESSSHAITGMYEILFEYPDVIVINDPYENNTCWSVLPFMGAIPEQVRPEMFDHNPVGMFVITSDAESISCGEFPSAVPGRTGMLCAKSWNTIPRSFWHGWICSTDPRMGPASAPPKSSPARPWRRRGRIHPAWKRHGVITCAFSTAWRQRPSCCER